MSRVATSKIHKQPEEELEDKSQSSPEHRWQIATNKCKKQLAPKKWSNVWQFAEQFLNESKVQISLFLPLFALHLIYYSKSDYLLAGAWWMLYKYTPWRMATFIRYRKIQRFPTQPFFFRYNMNRYPDKQEYLASSLLINCEVLAKVIHKNFDITIWTNLLRRHSIWSFQVLPGWINEW